MYIYDNISLNSSYNGNDSDKTSRESKNTHFMFKISSPKIVPFMEKCERSGTVRQTANGNTMQRMSFACSINKATNTHYNIAFPR
jgi:hypothetical protein